MKTKEESLELVKKYQSWVEAREGERPNLSNSDLRFSDLSNSNLSYSNLSFSNLSHSDLSYSNLRNSDLRNSDLSFSNLSHSNLRFSNLSNSDLSCSNLSNSNLSYSNLSNSNLSYSNLRNSNLDYSVWGLSCRTASSTIKVCDKIASQLLYHALIVTSSNNKKLITPEIKEFIKKNFHRYNECEKL